MLYVIVREGLVLLLGVVISLIVSLLTKNVAVDWKMAAALLVPVGLCLIRACWTSIPHRSCTFFRYFLASIFVAGAIVILFLFEILVGVLTAQNNLPVGVWIIPATLAAAYIAAYTIAWWIGSESALASVSDDVRTL